MLNLRACAERLLDNGYVPLRIEPRSKAPKMPGWQKVVVTREVADRWFSRPANIGVRCGDPQNDGTALCGIDIDLEDVNLIRCVERAIGQSVPVKRGKKGFTYLIRLDREYKSHKIYWTRDGKKRPAIDILCRGAQTVIPPSIHPDTDCAYQWVAGTSIEQLSYSDLPLFTPAVIDEIRGYARNPDDPIYQLNDMEWLGVGGGGNTHDVCVAAVASMVARNWSDAEIQQRVERAKREACEAAGTSFDWPASHKVIQEWIDSCRNKKFDTQTGHGSSAKGVHGVLADQFLEMHGDVVRFDRDRSEWYFYDGVLWSPKQEYRVRDLIGQNFLSDHLRTKGVVDGVLSSLRDRPALSMQQDAWDPERFLLNTPGGTVDLRTAVLRPHSPDDYITRCTRVTPSDEHPSFFLDVLTQWIGDDPVERTYHQRLIGYFLTGETRDPCLAIWYGPGGDGKSKYAALLEWMMGDYAQTATETAFLETRSPQHSEEIACLRGARLVLSGEASGKWNESRIKAITGGDRLSGSFKFKPVFTFTPEFKPLVTTNEPPRLISTGNDIARRLHVYPFPRKIEKPDSRLPEKLQEIGGAIMSWAIRGSVEYYRDGLLRSPVVESANAEYLLEHDTLQQFLDEETVKVEGAKIRTTLVYDALKIFYEDRGHRPPSLTTLTKRLRAKGIECRPAQLEKGQVPQRAYFDIVLRGASQEDMRF